MEDVRGLVRRVATLEKEVEHVIWKLNGMERAFQVCRKQVCGLTPLTGKALELKKELEKAKK